MECCRYRYGTMEDEDKTFFKSPEHLRDLCDRAFVLQEAYRDRKIQMPYGLCLESVLDAEFSPDVYHGAQETVIDNVPGSVPVEGRVPL